MIRIARKILLSLIITTGAIATPIAMGTGLEGCAHVTNFLQDAKTCFGADVKGDLGDLVQGIETALVCDLVSGPDALPACAIEGLDTIANEIGPSGKADIQCVVDKLATSAEQNKMGATPEDVVRVARAKLIRSRGGVEAVIAALRASQRSGR